MPPKKPVPSLVDLSVASIREMVCVEALRVAHVAVTKFVYDEVVAQEQTNNDAEVKSAWEREVFLSDQIEVFKEYLISQIPRNLMEKALKNVILGIEDATLVKKRSYLPTTSMTRFSREMYAIVKFSNVLVQKQRTSLDLETVPMIIRSKLYSCLQHFESLRSLVLGSGSGGWVTSAYNEYFLLGIPKLRYLVRFSLKYDCTENVLQVLSETAGATLRSLDIEYSAQVKDASAEYILRLTELEEVGMFRTGMNIAAKAEILVGLKNLQHLRRGDYLCEVLDYLEENHYALSLRLKIKDFWASEDYYFHSDRQMELVGRCCPEITKMTFMFNSQFCRLSRVAAFEHLTHLEIWGGTFYVDNFTELFEVVGHNLKKLSLVHCEDMDKRAFAILTMCCPGLEALGLHNCEFLEERATVDEQGWEFRPVEDIKPLPLLDVTSVKISSNLSNSYLLHILEACLNVRELFLGISTSISDETLAALLEGKNSLQHLERLTIQQASNVTMAGVKLLLLHCDKLREFKYLSAFKKINPMELAILRAELRDTNADLDTGEEEEKAAERLKEDTNFGPQADAIAQAFSALSTSSGIDLGAGWEPT